ncbi:814_t:CDS:1, partial [Entrophospora sp. SA101]
KLDDNNVGGHNHQENMKKYETIESMSNLDEEIKYPFTTIVIIYNK